MLELVHAWELLILFQDIAVAALLLTALLWGGGPERATIAVWVLCLELPTLIVRGSHGYEGIGTGLSPHDTAREVAAGIIWVVIALYANRNYTLWIAGVQLLAIGANLSRLMADAISPTGFALLLVLPGWFQLVFMTVGFSRHIVRKRKFGAYRGWRPLLFVDSGIWPAKRITRAGKVLPHDIHGRSSNR